MKRMSTAEKLLKLLLVLDGAACVSGVVGLYMPLDWMVAGHTWLGMGDFPKDAHVAEQLARLTSGLYGIYGALVILMAIDVRRYAPLITAQAVMIMTLGLSATYFGYPREQIPRWWLLVDSVSVVSFCAATLVLQAKIRAEDRRKARSAAAGV